jgi:signal transduction histidine kinase
MSKHQSRPIDFLRHGAIVAGFNTLLSFGLSMSNRDWLTQMVYTQAIGLSIWACIDFGRFLFKRDPASAWPKGWRFWLLQSAGIVIGYLLGTVIGDLYCGCSFWSEWASTPRRVISYVMLALGVSASISFFFYARGQNEQRKREIADAQRDAHEARLKLLESQLEPHMLFNTLANLRVLIEVDPPRAQQMLDRLIAFLRATLSASRASLHPLSAEFDRLRDYLELMQVRMGTRLRVRLDLPEELAQLPVPPLLLQPLVENAIKHGLEPHVEGGELRVRASRVGDTLVLEVRDTGAGLSDRTPGEALDGTRFGLSQVRERIATLHGERASLQLAPAADADGGTLVTLRLPL